MAVGAQGLPVAEGVGVGGGMSRKGLHRYHVVALKGDLKSPAARGAAPPLVAEQLLALRAREAPPVRNVGFIISFAFRSGERRVRRGRAT